MGPDRHGKWALYQMIEQGKKMEKAVMALFSKSKLKPSELRDLISRAENGLRETTENAKAPMNFRSLFVHAVKCGCEEVVSFFLEKKL